MKFTNLPADDKSAPSDNLQRRHNSQLHMVRGVEMRVAETRAVNRALRKAYGIGTCSVEEIGSLPTRGQAEANVRKLPPQRTAHYSRSLLCTLRAPLGPASQYSFPCKFSPLFRCHLRKAGLSSLKSAQPTESHCVRILDLLLSGHFTNSLSQIRSNSNVLAFTIALWYISIP